MKRLILKLLLLTYLLSSLEFQAQSGNCLKLDGINDFIQVNDASLYVSGSNEISMAGWFCLSDMSYGQGYFSLRDNFYGGSLAGDAMYVVKLNFGELECRYVNNAFENQILIPSGIIQLNQWHHVAAVFNGFSFTMYVNGNLIESIPASGIYSETVTPFPFSIGRTILSGWADNFCYDGKIDEVSLWSRALSQLEIQDMMANELMGTEINLELYYKMDQGIPDGNNTAITELISEVGGGSRNGNFVNMSLNGPNSNFVEVDDPYFEFEDYCVNAASNGPINIAMPGGAFSILSPVDAATINSSTGEISGGIAGTTYEIEYTTNGSCGTSSIVFVEVFDILAVTNITHSCSADQTTYSVSFDILGGDPPSYGISGTATTPPGGSLTGSSFTTGPIPSGDTYSITVNDITTCIPVTITDSYTCTCPATAVINDDINICPGDMGNLTIIFTGTGPWDIVYNDGTSDQTILGISDNTYSLSVGTPGSYMLVSVEDANCVGTVSGNASVTVLTIDDPGFTFNDFCAGSVGSPSGIVTPGGTFAFNPDLLDGATINAGTGDITNGVAGTTYSVSYNTAGACPDAQTLTVDVTSSDDPGFTFNDFCAGSVGSPSGIVTPGGTFAFNPDLLDGATINAGTGDITNGVAGTTYSVSYNTAGACPDAQTLTVDVTSSDDPGFTFNDFCAGSVGSPSGIVTPGGTFAFNPDLLDGATINAGTGDITNGVAGTTYSVSYTTAGICPDSQTLTVDVTTSDDPGFTFNDFCAGSVGSPSGIVTPGGTFAFNPDLLDGSTINAGTGDITNGVAGTTYSVSYTTAGICPDAQTLTVDVTTSDDPGFTFNDFCEGSIGSPSGIVTSGGTFAFNPDLLDGATINAGTGDITNGVAGTTYSVSYTTVGTCPDSQTLTVDVTTSDDPGFTFNDFCAGSVGSPSGIVTPGGTFAFNPDLLDGATINASTGDITNGVAGTTYSVLYTTAGACPDAQTLTVDVTTSNDPGFTFNDFCAGSDGSPSGIVTPGGTFAFNPDLLDGAIINAGTGDITNGVAGTTYSVLYTTAGACPDAQTLTVDVTTSDDPGFTFNDFCEGSVGSPSGIVTPGGTFAFNPDLLDGATINASTGDITNGVAGATYSVSYTTAGACPDAQTLTVDVTTSDDPGFTFNDFCAGSVGSPSGIVTPGGTFAFNPDLLDGAIISAGTGDITNGVAGTTYSVSYTTVGTCPDSQTLTVDVTTSDDPGFTFNDFCAGSVGSPSGIVTPGGTFAFNPDLLDGATINASTGDITNGVAGTTYSVSYTTAGACPDAQTLTVDVTTSNDPGFTFNDFCAGSDGSPSGIVTSGGTFAFNPDLLDGAIINAGTGDITNGVAGTTYSVLYTTAGACPDAQTLTVDVTTSNDPGFTFNDFCAGSDGSPSGIVTPGGTFAFNPDLLDGAIINAGTGDITNGVAGTTYSVLYTTAGACPDAQTLTVDVTTSDDPGFTFNDFCEGSVGSPSGIVTPGGTFAFNPDLLDGATINASTGDITNGVAGATYSVSYTTAGACPDAQTLTVDVTTSDDPGFTFNDFCAGSVGSPSGIVTPGGTFAFNPDLLDGAIISAGTGDITNGVAGTTYSVSYTTVGTCPDSQTLTVDVTTSDDPGFTFNDFCAGSVGSPSGIVTPGGTFAFNPDLLDGATINASTGDITNGVAGTTYSVSYTTAGACPDAQTLTVDVTTSNDPGFTFNDFCAGSDGSPSGIVTSGGTFAFNPDLLDGAIINAGTGDITNGVAGTTYSVLYTTAGACPDAQTLTVDVTTSDDPGFTFNDFCEGSVGSPSGIVTPGGTFAFNPDLLDGATINASTGDITNGVAGATYSVSYTTAGACPDAQTLTVDVTTSDDPGFTFNDFCAGSVGSPSGIVTPGGTFAFNPDLLDGAIISAGTGDIANGVAGTTYSVSYTTAGTCPDAQTLTVDVTTSDDPGFSFNNFCAGSVGSPSGIVTPGGTFAFNPDLLDGATINAGTGDIANGVAGTTYSVSYTTSGICPDAQTLTVDVTTSDDPGFTFNDFCAGSVGSPSVIVTPGGTFAFNPDLLDGATINTGTGDITNGVAGTTYSVSYTTAGICPDAQTLTVDVTTADDPGFTFNDFCAGSVGSPSGIVTPGGTFAFNPDLLDGATINASTGDIANGVAGTTYSVSYTTAGICPSSVSQLVNVFGILNILNLTETCAADQLTYTVSFDITGGDPTSYVVTGDPGTLTGSTFVSDPIVSGVGYDFTADDVNSCSPSNITGLVNCACPASADISGNVNICAGATGDLIINFMGTGPWDIVYNDGITDITLTGITDNPFTLSTSTIGTYTLVSVDDVNCSGSVSGTASVTELTSPTITNIVESCAADQLTYTVSFDITGGDPTSYVVSGDPGTLTGSTFVSDPIVSGGGYDFTADDVNSCSPANITGLVNCACLASADISGDVNICAGASGDLIINFMGTGPWDIVYNDGTTDITLTGITDNPFTLSTSTIGTYTLVSVDDVNCSGSVSGTASVTELTSPTITNIVESCAADQLTYTVSFDITGGDPTSYVVSGDPGTLTGSTFVSDPIVSGGGYDFTADDVNSCSPANITGLVNCACLASADISGDVNICAGASGDLIINFMGTGPWDIVYNDGTTDITLTGITDNPFTLSTSTIGTYTLVSVDDVNCSGSVSGTASVTELNSPTITNIVESCAADQLTYTVSFDITGGDPTSYVVSGDPGTLTGSTFVSDPIVSGGGYDFTADDVNSCSPSNITGLVNCACPASADISGNVNICAGATGDLIINFMGTGPWDIVYNDGTTDITLTGITDNPFTLSTSTIGTYTLVSVDDVNCSGSVSGTASVTELTSPTITNIVESCAADQLTYTVSFDITGGDPTSYVVTGDPGTLTGSTFVSNPILSGVGYSFDIDDLNSCIPLNFSGSVTCSCITSAIISGDINICPGTTGDLIINFMGTGPWDIVYNDGASDITLTGITDNPFTLSTTTIGTYTLVSVDDANCAGSVSGTASVTELTSPTITNIDETCAADQLTYTVSFDIIGGDPTSYVVTGDPGTLIGSTFVSNPIVSGVGYDFTADDVNSCSPSNITGLVNCACPASADISGDVNICAGATGDLIINFMGTGPWDIVYNDGTTDITLTGITDNPFTLSTTTIGTYTLVSVDDANCSGSVSGMASVTELTSPTITNIVETCAADQLTYTVSFDITGGDPTSYVVTGDPGTLTGSTFVSDPILSGVGFDFTADDVNSCSPSNITGLVNCACPASADISGDVNICAGASGDLIINFMGTGPWDIVYNDGTTDITLTGITDNPFTLSTSTIGTYTLVSVDDANCSGSVSGMASVTELTSPTITNIVETCAADQLTYTVSFEISGGDPASYIVSGDPGTLTGSTFVSNPIVSGVGYDFTADDVNSCSPSNITGLVNCACLASADISGDVNICAGASGDLIINFMGTGPWDIVYNDGATDITLTGITDNPFTLSTSTIGTYTLVSVDDANCSGSVSGTASVTELTSPTITNIVETCAADQLTYTVSFEITGGDPTSYVVTGDPGTLTGSTFVSDPIVSGVGYSFDIDDFNSCIPLNFSGSVTCTCITSAIISGDINICPGTTGDLIVNFTGTGPWTLSYNDGTSDETLIGITDNPLMLATGTAGTYTLISVNDAFCSGTVSGTATVTEYSSPTIINLSETCSTDQLTYTVSFEIIGGDPTSYAVTDDPGTLTGNLFVSDPILSGTSYVFTVSDINSCANTITEGFVICECEATANISGDASICPGNSGDLTIEFTGTGPWDVVYNDGTTDISLTGITVNPFTLSTGTAGNYTLISVNDSNCFGSVSGTASVTELTSPIITNLVETCAPDQLTYTVSFDIAGGDPLTYSVVGDPGALTGSTFLSDPLPSGMTYDFTVNESSGCGTDNVNGVVICTCPASASINGDMILCSGTIGNLTIEFTGSAPWTFSYSINDIEQIAVSTSDNPYLLPVGVAGQYELISVSDANCIGEIFGIVNVTEVETPTAIISGSDSICSGESTFFNIEFTGTGPWDVIYALNGTIYDTFTTTDNPYVLEVTEHGDYTIQSVTTNSCTSAGIGIGNLHVFELPTASINGDIAICEDAPALLVINLTGTPDFTLNYNLDGVLQDPLTIDEPLEFEILVVETGQYELISISDLYCIGTATGVTNVSIEPLPTASLNGDFTICNGNEQLIPVVLTGTNDWTINYTIDGIDQTPLETDVTPFLIPATEEGEYVIESVQDNFCNNVGEGVANISFFPPITVIAYDNDDICIGDTAQILVSASGGMGNDYQYAFSNPYILVVDDSIAWLNPDQNTTIEVNVNDDCNYNQTFDIPINVNQLPPVSFNGIQSICGYDQVNFTNTTPEAYVGNICSWIINGDSLEGCSGVSYFFGEVNEYDVQLNVTSFEGCYNELLIENYLEVYPQPIADFDFSPEDPNVSNPLIYFNNLSSENIDNYLWQFGEEGSSTEINPSFDFPILDGPDSWLVCLNVSNNYGCADSICHPLDIDGEIIINVPNTFTPDGDGLNDLFHPVIIGADADEYIFRIYDRYGDTVFETDDISEKWNGGVNSNMEYYSPDGLYNWQVFAKVQGSSEIKEYLGSILLIR